MIRGGEPLDAAGCQHPLSAMGFVSSDFYMIFPSGSAWIIIRPLSPPASFCPPDRQNLLNELVRAFRGAVLDMEQVVPGAHYLRAGHLGHRTGVLFVLAAGFAVRYAALAASLDGKVP